jgi:hypothetical protein
VIAVRRSDVAAENADQDVLAAVVADCVEPLLRA